MRLTQLIENDAPSDSLWLNPQRDTITVPTGRWGSKFFEELHFHSDDDVGLAAEIHWENIAPWLKVAKSGSLHTPGQIDALVDAIRDGLDVPPVVRSWMGDRGSDAVSYQEEEGDYPYFRDGKHRVIAAAKLGLTRVPVISVTQWSTE